MDPLSITTGCVTLIATVGKTSLTVVNFIKKCREARADLTSVNRELSELCLVLEILREDTAEDDSVIPSSVQNQILSIISSCSDVLSRIGSALTKHHGRTAPIRWAIDGSDSIQNLRQLLEGHRGALSLAVDTVALAKTREIKRDTSTICADAIEIKQDTAKILDEIARLKALLPQDRLRNRASFILHRYLDDVNSYAETVYDEIESTQCEVGTIREAGQHSIETIHEATGIQNSVPADTTHETEYADVGHHFSSPEDEERKSPLVAPTGTATGPNPAWNSPSIPSGSGIETYHPGTYQLEGCLTCEGTALPTLVPRAVRPWARRSWLDKDGGRSTISPLSTDRDISSPTVSLLSSAPSRKLLPRAQNPNASSGPSNLRILELTRNNITQQEKRARVVAAEHGVRTREPLSDQAGQNQGQPEIRSFDAQQGVDSSLIDAAIEADEGIEVNDVLALMQRLMLRDAQRSARDTEVITLLMNSASEMRKNYKELEQLRDETDNLSAEDDFRVPEQSVATEQSRAYLEDRRPRNPDAGEVRHMEFEYQPTKTKTKSLWQKALTAFGCRNDPDLSKIEDMLMDLLGEVDGLKTYTDPSISVERQLEAPTDERRFGYVEESGGSY